MFLALGYLKDGFLVPAYDISVHGLLLSIFETFLPKMKLSPRHSNCHRTHILCPMSTSMNSIFPVSTPAWELTAFVLLISLFHWPKVSELPASGL